MTLESILILAAVALIVRVCFPKRGRIFSVVIVSILVIFWLQPATPIRYLDFWLPTGTVALSVLIWLVTSTVEERNKRENWITFFVIAMELLGLALTRYLGIDGVLTASRPPQIYKLAIFLFVLVGLFFAATHFDLSGNRLLKSLIGLLIFLFIALKSPQLAALVSKFLRSISGQSVDRALATDLRWLGFSYVAFRLIHALRDKQTGRLPAVTLGEFIAYILFFPAFTAGPIDRLPRFIKDLRKPLEWSASEFGAAGKRLLIGLFKKFIVADTLALIAINSTNALQINSSGWAWVLLYAYAFQIYFDFSGYTDIAIGLGMGLGIYLPENFNRPYLKPNLTLFWNNWHMTLTQWLRAYIFNPITRYLRRNYRKLQPGLVIFITQMITMVVIGLWHGITLNFLFWGMWHGIGLFIQNRFSNWIRPHTAKFSENVIVNRFAVWGSTFLTFNYVAIGWLWFALPTPQLSIQALRQLFGFL